MPTPRESIDELAPRLETIIHSSCPPEPVDRPAQWSRQVLGDIEHAVADVASTSTTAHPADSPKGDVTCNPRGSEGKEEAGDGSSIASPNACTTSATASSPRNMNQEEETIDGVAVMSQLRSSPTSLPYSLRHGIYSTRLIQTQTSCKLRAGSRYRGTQTSDAQRYRVEVDVKDVDMSESFICGYLKIEGLTPEHATLTTFFEGEIIGPKYTFQTRHDNWGASEKDDMKHWGHFPAWKPLAKQAKRADFDYKHLENRESIFMRWKEKFLVPDHRVKEISGASFEGFYYICFNQIAGAISGIYYHSKSDQHHNNKIQNLELEWVPDRGRVAAMEFR